MSKPSVAIIVDLVALLALPAQSNSQPAALDSSFNPALNSGAQVYAVALQTNGQILIGGLFTSVGSPQVTNVARLNQDGTLDSTFNPGTAADRGYVAAIAVQNDGKVVIGGSFASSTAAAPGNLARLNTNGTADISFDRSLWMDDAVNAVQVQTDGQILFGGAFSIVDGFLRRSAARLNSDGTLDIGFDACVASSSGFGATALALLNDEKILMSGNFTFAAGEYRLGIARLNPKGDLDTSYAPQDGINSDSIAYTLARRADGTALLGGNFRTYHGSSWGGIVQLTTNGYPDADFESGAGINFGGTVYTIALQNDGKIIIGGDFTDYNVQTRHRLARLNMDGSLDSSFDPATGPNDLVGTIVVQRDRKILVAGKFSSLNGTPRNGLARLNGDHLLSRLDPPGWLGNGQIQVVFYGEAQAHYALLASSNLVDWISITNFTASSGAMPIVDPTASPPAKRFYRAVSVP